MQPPPQQPYGSPPQFVAPQGASGGAQPPGLDLGMTPGGAEPGPVSVIAAVKFPFGDKDWAMSVLFGLIFMVIPIVGPIALGGWFCEVHQRLVRKHPRPLAKLDFADLGSYIGRGIKPFVVQLVVALPTGLLLGICYFAVGVGGGIAAAAMDEPAFAFVFLGVFVVVALLFALFVNVLLNAAVTRAEQTEDIGKSLRLGELMEYGKATWLQVVVKSIFFGFVAIPFVLVGLLACGVGVYAAAVILQIGQVHLRWQVYNDYLRKGGKPIDLAPPQRLASEAYGAPGY